MDRPKRLTPKKNDASEMIGLLPEEEAALRKALLASMQSEKTIAKKTSPVAPSKRGSKRGGQRGRCRRARAIRGQSERLGNFETRCESLYTDDAHFSSSSPFAEPKGMEMSQDVPEQSSDSESNFSTEESVNWTPGRKEMPSYNQILLQESASIESDMSSYNGHDSQDFQLTLSQSDSTTPNEPSSPLPGDGNKNGYQSLDSKLTIACLQRAQKNTLQCPVSDLGKRSQTDILRTEDFVSFLCMRKEYQQMPGLLRHFKVTKTRGITRSSQCRKRKLAEQKKKHTATKKLVFYKQTDM